MDLKKIIFTVFLLFMLNFSVPFNGQFQQGREKNQMSFVISVKENNNTSNFFKENRKLLFTEFISCYFRVLIIDRANICFDST